MAWSTMRFYWIAAETGMRGGEIRVLRWSDIGIISVLRRCWDGVVITPKTKSSYRSFAISPELVRRLGRYASQILVCFSSAISRHTGNVRKPSRVENVCSSITEGLDGLVWFLDRMSGFCS